MHINSMYVVFILLYQLVPSRPHSVIVDCTVVEYIMVCRVIDKGLVKHGEPRAIARGSKVCAAI